MYASRSPFFPPPRAAVASDSKRRVQFSRILPSPISDNLAFDVNGGELSSRERPRRSPLFPFLIAPMRGDESGPMSGAF